MAKGKSSKHSGKGKGGSKASGNKVRTASSGSRSASSNVSRPVNSRTGPVSKGKTSGTRGAFMRGARSRGGVGVWGLVGLLSALVVFAVLYFTGALSPDAEDSNAGLQGLISVEDAYKLYPDDAFFLDVRDLNEWDTGHVPDTINIPLDQLADRVNELPTDQDIVVICRSGNRSEIGRDLLLQAGFKNVTSMVGGVSDWKDAGYPYDGEVYR